MSKPSEVCRKRSLGQNTGPNARQQRARNKDVCSEKPPARARSCDLFYRSLHFLVALLVLPQLPKLTSELENFLLVPPGCTLSTILSTSLGSGNATYSIAKSIIHIPV